MVRLRDSWPFNLSSAPTVGNPCRPLQPESVLRERNAALEAEVRLLRQMLDDMKGERGDLKAERDRWAAQAERLALAPPHPPAPQPAAPQGRSWWPWRQGCELGLTAVYDLVWG